jgi:hypothetical protein
MSRVANDWASGSKENYLDFVKKNPKINLSIDDWRKIIYSFNYTFMEHILETGEKISIPSGLGKISINKKYRKKTKVTNDKQYVNLPIDWKKTKEKGKRIYNFNYHTEGYFFGWKWFSETARFKYCEMFYFKPTRNMSRLLKHYIEVDEKYQHIYVNWNLK